jgi:hypothetical protein
MMLTNARDRKIPIIDPIKTKILLNVAPTVGATKMIAMMTAKFGDTTFLEIFVMKIKQELIMHAKYFDFQIKK